MIRQSGVLCGLAALVLISTAAADVLTTRDGKVFEGLLIKREAGKIHFEIHKYGATIVKVFAAAEVVSIDEKPLAPRPVPDKPTQTAPTTGPSEVKAPPKPPPKPPRRRPVRRWDLPLGQLPPEPAAPPIVKYEGKTYYVVPLKGEVGWNIAARVLEASLEDAVARKPDVVILDMDSPGGSVLEAERIVQVIRKFQGELRMIVLADQALSAAAVTSLTVKEIYLKSSGVIGAATAYREDFFGFPVVLEEKAQSIWRATARSAAETGGHNPLIAEAMIDPNIELHLEKQDGKVVVKEGRGARMLSRRGRLLTMTSSDAVKCGLAAGVAQDYAELGKKIGFENWTECKGLGVPLAEYWKQVVEKLHKDLNKLYKTYAKGIEKARENHPRNGKYLVGYNGKFIPSSRRLWTRRSLDCVKCYKVAREAVKTVVALLGKLDETKHMVGPLKKLQRHIEEEAAKVYKKRNKSRWEE